MFNRQKRIIQFQVFFSLPFHHNLEILHIWTRKILNNSSDGCPLINANVLNIYLIWTIRIVLKYFSFFNFYVVINFFQLDHNSWDFCNIVESKQNIWSILANWKINWDVHRPIWVSSSKLMHFFRENLQWTCFSQL